MTVILYLLCSMLGVHTLLGESERALQGFRSPLIPPPLKKDTGTGPSTISWSSQPGSWACMQVTQEALAAIRGVGSQAHEEVVVWARFGALLGDPLPQRQRALTKEERAALAMRVC